ncbi:uncharacterized protein LY89DRAFT_788118 [Mollisia scopiformis]|uniref:Uncharacterized protein n=1 Tax=Mollisia scopiformis TaxID=149040 RepID=A0A132B9X8_MOLSC|nr:uncharacterized protein LY89DRAFT_788118 [Mollisia scopiformis]KUJ09212.1 hypothetical protein LY89DRAFT_788118 [Mollisia scopiformis]
MQFSKLAAITSLLAGVIATPIAGEATKLAKRSEGVHLVNCGSEYSVVVYCPNDSDCNHSPPSGDGCFISGIDTWEGFEQSCTFSTGTTFTWNIEAYAQSEPDYTEVGTGTNTYHNFDIYKDDQHVMYYDGNGYACKSIYYCLDNQSTLGLSGLGSMYPQELVRKCRETDHKLRPTIDEVIVSINEALATFNEGSFSTMEMESHIHDQYPGIELCPV